jgi:hypothetical protein
VFENEKITIECPDKEALIMYTIDGASIPASFHGIQVSIINTVIIIFDIV